MLPAAAVANSQKTVVQLQVSLAMAERLQNRCKYLLQYLYMYSCSSVGESLTAIYSKVLKFCTDQLVLLTAFAINASIILIGYGYIYGCNSLE